MSDSSRRDIELRIRAQDLSTADFQRVSAAVKELAAAVGQETAAARAGAIGVAELRSEITKLEQAGKALTSIGTAIDRFKDLSGVIRANEATVESARQKLATYRAQLEQSNDTSAKAERQLTGYVNALKAAEASLERNRTALANQSALLGKAGIDTANLAQAETLLKQAADQVGTSLTALNEAQLNHAKYAREAKDALAQLKTEQLAAATAAKAEAEAVAATQAVRKQQTDQVRATITAVRTANQQQTASLEAFNAETRRLTKERRDADAQAERDATKTAILEERQRFAARQQFFAQMKEQEEKFNAETRRLTKQRHDQATADANAAVAAIRRASQPQLPQPGDIQSQAQQRFFGLRPYELQNLSYQINDIVSGFAMGQRATQILAQQGGQVLQLFNNNLFDLLKYLPAVGVGIATITVSIEALVHAFRDQAAVRAFTGALDLNANGAQYNAMQLAGLQKQVRDLGIAWQDSGTVIRAAVDAGVRPEKLKDFAQAARDAADITGKTVPEAMQLLLGGLKGGVEGILKLNDQFKFLTVEQYRQIAALVDQGKTGEATTRVYDLLFAKLRQGATDAMSPFTRATRDLSKAWNDFLDALAHTAIFDNLTAALDKVAFVLERISKIGRDNPAVLNIIGAALKASLGAPIGGAAGIGALGDALNRGVVASAPVPPATGLQIGNGIIAEATAELGLNERRDREQLRQYMRAGGADLDPATIAWCAAFANAVLARQGIRGTGSNVATSFLNFGNAVTGAPSAGDIVVVPNGAAPGQTGGHVGFATGNTREGSSGTQFEIIAGNTQDQVAKSWINAADAVVRRVSQIPAAGGLPPGQPGQTGNAYATTPADEQSRGQARLNQAQRAFDLEFSSTREIQRQRKEIELRNEASTQFNNDEQRAAYVRLELQKFDLETAQKQRDENQRIAQLRITDGKNADAIYAAGIAKRQQELEVTKGLVSVERLYQVQLQGEAEERAKLQQNETLKNREREIDNQISALARQAELKDTTTLEARLKAVDDQYANVRRNVQRLAEDLKNTTTGPKVQEYLDKITPKIDTQEAQAKSLETAKFYSDKLASLQSQRTELVNAENAALAAGGTTVSEAEDKIRQAFERTTPAIKAVADEFQKFLDTDKNLDPTKIDLYKAKIQELRANATYISPLMKDIKTAVENSFTTGMTNAFNTVAEAVGKLIAKTGSWKDVIASVKSAAANFFAGLLKDIAAAILKYEALKIASSLFGIGSGGGDGEGGIFGSLFGGAAKAGFGGSINDFGGGGAALGVADVVGVHSGGVIGQTQLATRPAAVSWFANAPRYHTGTIVGLSPDEQAAILRKGEEVLSADNPRNIMNRIGGSGGSPDVNIRNVLVMDENLIPSAMASSRGERTTMAHVIKNAATIRQLVKG